METIKYVVVIGYSEWWDDGPDKVYGPFDTREEAEDFRRAEQNRTDYAGQTLPLADAARDGEDQ